MSNSAKKHRKRAKHRHSRAAAYAESAAVVAQSPRFRRLSRLWDAIRDSHFMRGASTLTLFPQHPEVDISVHAQRRDLAQTWREVYGCLWDAYYQESDRVREYERKK